MCDKPSSSIANVFQETHSSTSVTSSYIMHTMKEIEKYDAIIYEKSYDLHVYEDTRRIIEEKRSDPCLVLIGLNLFVERSLADGIKMLERQIKEKQEFLKKLHEEKAMLQKRIEMLKFVEQDNRGQVEIREAYNGPERKNTKRIAHTPKHFVCSRVEGSENVEPAHKKKGDSETSQTSNQTKLKNDDSVEETRPSSEVDVTPSRPRGIPEKEFQEFLELVENCMVSESEDEITEEGEEVSSSNNATDMSSSALTNKEDASNSKNSNCNDAVLCDDGNTIKLCSEEDFTVVETTKDLPAHNTNQFTRHVHFPQKMVDFNTDVIAADKPEGSVEKGASKLKPILRNKDEISPVNEKAVKKMDKWAGKKVVPMSDKILTNQIVEKNVENHLHTNETEISQPTKKMSSLFKKSCQTKNKV